jgi:hypothetical protein
LVLSSILRFLTRLVSQPHNIHNHFNHHPIAHQAAVSHKVAVFHSACRLYACVDAAHSVNAHASAANLGYLLAILAACVAICVPPNADQASHAVAAVASEDIPTSQTNSQAF